jgi:hypothetical protein
MDGLPLPPPPGAQERSSSTPPSDNRPDTRDPIFDRPGWRQGRPGWALLHVGISMAIAVVAFFIAFIAVAAAGRTDADIDRASDGLFALGMLVIFATSMVGWFLFAYLRGSLGRRWTALGASVGVGWLVAVGIFLQATG